MLSLDSIFSNSSDIALCAFSFPFPWIRPKLHSTCSFTFRHSCRQVFHGAYIWLHGYIVQPFGNIHFRTLPTTASADFSQFVVTTVNVTAYETSRGAQRPVDAGFAPTEAERRKSVNLSSSTCLIYAHGLRLPLGLRCLKPAHPPCTPYIRFLFVRLRFRYPFFSPISHDTNLGSCYGVRRQLRPLWTFTTDWRHARHTKKAITENSVIALTSEK